MVVRLLMLPNAKIETLTNMINIKYFFVSPRTCDGDSPRIQLLIDPGDGTGPHNAFGHIGDKLSVRLHRLDRRLHNRMEDALDQAGDKGGKVDRSQQGAGDRCTLARRPGDKGLPAWSRRTTGRGGRRGAARVSQAQVIRIAVPSWRRR